MRAFSFSWPSAAVARVTVGVPIGLFLILLAAWLRVIAVPFAQEDSDQYDPDGHTVSLSVDSRDQSSDPVSLWSDDDFLVDSWRLLEKQRRHQEQKSLVVLSGVSSACDAPHLAFAYFHDTRLIVASRRFLPSSPRAPPSLLA
jgi:hypothetical protein